MRPDILNPLFAPVEVLKGIGTALMRPLKKLHLERVIDVLHHLPTGVIERQQVTLLDEAREGALINIVVTPQQYQQGGGTRAPLRIICWDAQGDVVHLVYFGNSGNFARKMLPLHTPKRVSGKLDIYNDTRQIVHAEAHEIASSLAVREAVYPLSDGLTSKRLANLVAEALKRLPEMPEWIEPSLKAKHGWGDYGEALRIVHKEPRNELARARLAYDEVFANQLALMLVRASTRTRRGQSLQGDGHLRDSLRLPYAPTGAQRRTLQEIAGDMAQTKPMVRLLQGDVGAGKTWVALHALLIAVEAGVQGAFLAPTEILARQHYANFKTMLAGLPVEVALLTGREKGRVREAILMGLADGSIHILIGTHAIFQDAVTYKALGLAVIDEQHRFGVSQRMMLTAKATLAPHLLVMTATPIPRTLTLTHYGEMDVSRLDEMPPGRTLVETRVVSLARLADVVDALARHIAENKQAFWVCPWVEEGEGVEARASAQARATALKLRFGDAVGLVHGRMKGADKDAVMEAFSSGRLKVLVATTVVEVGVDVPNASLMIIEEADGFGLAQLHQLRGRVGRGEAKSTCLLLRSEHMSETARARLSLMRDTNDGFLLAEEDLRLRGAGEILGTRQSGEQVFRLASAEQVAALVPSAHDDARLLVERDGGLQSPRGQAARLCLYLFERDTAVGLLRAG